MRVDEFEFDRDRLDAIAHRAITIGQRRRRHARLLAASPVVAVALVAAALALISGGADGPTRRVDTVDTPATTTATTAAPVPPAQDDRGAGALPDTSGPVTSVGGGDQNAGRTSAPGAAPTPTQPPPASVRRITFSHEGRDLHTIDEDGTGRRQFLANATTAVWSPDGRHLLVWGGNRLEVGRSDGTGRTTIATDAYFNFGGTWSWSRDGEWVAYVQQGTATAAGIAVVRRDGTARRTIAAGVAQFPTFSPDGRRVAYMSAGSLWVVGVAGGTPTRLTPLDIELMERPEVAVRYSPTADVIAFLGRPRGGGPVGIWTIAGDGTGLREIRPSQDVFGLAWSPDGTRLAFTSTGGTDAQVGVWTIRADGSDPHRVTTDLDDRLALHPWSSDGSRLLFVRGYESLRTAAASGPPDNTQVVAEFQPGFPLEATWQPPAA